MTKSSVIPFSFENYSVRIIVIDGQPWFVAKDVCKVLELTNPRMSLQALDYDEKDVSSIYTLGGQQNMNIISESGMYTLVLRCRDAVKQGTLPHRFRKWVTNEVLPSIRKTGRYDRHQTKPHTKAVERFTHSDTRNLTHLVWCMTNGLRFERSWSNAVWLALREVTGTPSPERFQVEHIPLMADECRRIYYITETLRQIINDAEKQTIKRLLRKRENIDTVLAEIKQLFEHFHHQQIGIITARTDHWYEGELTHFLERH
ncbi:BRO-N domain-containing protein [Arsenophonus nasoniae]|uniref:Bro-N domain-containing protein n=1 Tax=Arsenophonus nasoniae TaxID=638 RepID=A0AA95GPD0_9GAMM|nr:Bro-N domain-containing protein [Arsenophonus nasoniae]WGM00540.1 Bro-N domain-containing protein [Arsenophonus nasoniae]